MRQVKQLICNAHAMQCCSSVFKQNALFTSRAYPYAFIHWDLVLIAMKGGIETRKVIKRHQFGYHSCHCSQHLSILVVGDALAEHVVHLLKGQPCFRARSKIGS